MMRIVENIKERLTFSKLPGYEAHKKMLPKGRVYVKNDDVFKESAVNLILFYKYGNLHFILTKRSDKLLHHSGQISLPGGAKDNEDKDLWETAKRETFEEVGLKVSDENLVGRLSKIVVPISGYTVQPYVSFFDKLSAFKINENEVAKILEVDFDLFFDKNNLFCKTISNKNIEVEYPYYKVQNEEVWGVTAMILSEFYDLAIS